MMPNAAHANLRFQLLVALCQGHIDLRPETAADPSSVADFLCELADHMADNLEAMALADEPEPEDERDQ